MSLQFTPASSAGQLLAKFWRDLCDDSGARAQLRRCRTPLEVMLNPAFHGLCAKFKSQFADQGGWETRLASIVGLSSHLDHRDHATVLAATGKDSYIEYFIMPLTQLQGERPRLSELRFRRLLQRESHELYPALIRVLRMVDGRTNLYGLAQSVFFWGDNIRKRWAFAYFPRVPSQ